MEKLSKSYLIKLRSENLSDKTIKTLINTIIGEMDRISKDPSEEQIIKVLNKMYKSNEEVTQTEEIIKEQEFLNSLLPKMMSTEELSSIVDSLNFKSIGEYMKYFKDNYSGKYDGKELSKIIKEKINN
jgi:uncharacterized protein YqeY